MSRLSESTVQRGDKLAALDWAVAQAAFSQADGRGRPAGHVHLDALRVLRRELLESKA